MLRRLAVGVAGAVLGGLLLGGCDEGNPPSPLPVTPDTSPHDPSPSTYLLRSDQLPGYRRSASETLSAATLAAAAGDPGLARTLEGFGFRIGARFTYQPPAPTAALAFQQVVSLAELFATADGASRGDSEARRRERQAPSGGGAVDDVAGLPSGGVDDLVVYRSTSSTAGTGTQQSFLAILRKGRVVVELFAGGDPGTATRESFSAVLASQELQLAGAPG